MAALYSVTVKYELSHTRGEIEPTVEEVQEAVKAAVNEGVELHVHVEREVDEVETDLMGEESSTGEKVTRIEGCRVCVDDAEVQEARKH